MFRVLAIAFAVMTGTIVVAGVHPRAAIAQQSVYCPSILYPCGFPTPGAGGGGGASPSPCPTSVVNSGCNVNMLNGDEGRSLALAVATALPIASGTTYVVVAGSTLVPRIVWGVTTSGNSVAAADQQLETGQTTSTPCDTNCVPWTGVVGLASALTSTSCLWGSSTASAGFGMCMNSTGIPLAATSPATNLYVKQTGTAPSGTINMFAYWTNPY